MRDEHDRGVQAVQVRLEPLERLDVEVVGRLVEQQQVGVAGERPAERRPRQLAAGERLERAIEIGVVPESEAVERRECAVAPRVAAGVLEPGLRLGVAGTASPRRGRRSAIACSSVASSASIATSSRAPLRT